MFTIYDGRKSFYQWDVNQKIVVDNLNCEIHFKHVGSSNAIICKPYKFENKIVVNVPNILLQESGSIVFWVFVNGEYTMETGKFNVTSRQKPADYVFTELEHLEYRKLNERIDAIEGGSISDETVERAIEAYLDENPIEAGATEAEAAQIEQNRKDIAELKESGGTAGEDGATYTPHVSAEGVISWTNDKGKENPDPVNIKGVKGDKGDDGAKGEPGEDGAKGEDGFSPVVNVTPISGGHTVEITDANGTKSFNVMNGVNGSGGDGSGDMIMSVYDTNGNGVVDNAEKFDGKTVDYFATANHEHSEYAPVEHTHDEYAPAEHTHSEYLKEFTETDPTVPTWAKAASKPTYTASEVGAAAAVHTHTKSQISDFPTSMPASDVSAWAKATSKPKYTASEVGLGNVANVKQYSASNPPPYPVTSVNGKTGNVVIESGLSYSTTETLTGDTWIDGKPIYMRTFTGNSGANKASVSIGNIPNLDMVVDFRGSVTVADYNLIEPIPSYRATTNALWHGIYISSSNHNVNVSSSFSEGAFFRVTVYYTKTTD